MGLKPHAHRWLPRGEGHRGDEKALFCHGVASRWGLDLLSVTIFFFLFLTYQERVVLETDPGIGT